MRIIFNEIKKIFNGKMIFLLIIINLILYFLFIEFDITYFPNGRPEKDIYKIHVEMREKYGPYMDNGEFEDFKKLYNKKLQLVNKYIKDNKEFKEAKVESYIDFISKEDKYTFNKDKRGDKFRKIRDKIIFEDEVDLFWEIPNIENIIHLYENRSKDMIKIYTSSNDNVNQRKERIKYILSKGYETSVLPEMVINNYNRLIKNVTLVILVSVIFMISPVYVIDKKRNLNYIQYTTKNGRGLFFKKGLAGIIGTIIITTTELILFFIIYSRNKTYMFLDCSINSVFVYNCSWYDVNFMGHIIITIIAIYILAVEFSLISMVISSITSKYITVIGLQIPIVIGFNLLILEWIVTKIESIRFIKAFFPLCYLGIFIVPIIIFIVRWKKEKTLDILN